MHAPKLYGRRKGRPFSMDLTAANEEGLRRFAIPSNQIEAATNSALSPADLFGGENYQEYWLEIGFGGGDFLAGQAGAHPDIGIIGSEAYENGVAKCLQKLLAQKSRNARIYNDDVRQLLPKLRNGVFTRVFLLFPDPWPKKRHAKRRFVNPENLSELARLIPPGGQFWIATDDPTYKNWAAEQMAAQSWFTPILAPWATEPMQPWFETGYQRKAIRMGRVPGFAVFSRR